MVHWLYEITNGNCFGCAVYIYRAVRHFLKRGVRNRIYIVIAKCVRRTHHDAAGVVGGLVWKGGVPPSIVRSFLKIYVRFGALWWVLK